MSPYSSEGWDSVARVLVGHSTATSTGDRVAIIMRETGAEPLARAVYRECVSAGAFPQVLYTSSLFERDLMIHGNAGQIEWVPELYIQAMEWADVCIDLRGTANLHEFESIDASVIAAHRKSQGKVSARRTSDTRWVICRVPSPLFAQQARLPTDEVMDLFFNATCIDWEAEGRRLQALRERLVGTAEVRIVSPPDTDLRFSTSGRTYVVDDGHINMPGGEIFTAPVEDSMEGVISFPHPGVFAGTLIENIRLEFSAGRVIQATASSNQTFLEDIISMDDGARRVGEFGIGTNTQLTSFSNDIFWDEKIAGTIHLALGRSYKECGGANDSALHWDIVLDLRTGGTVFVDGKPVIVDGQFCLQ
ncbi:MAG: aminopeptidase [Spirochaetales bacterium]|nr:aminopeptidase [Spirochaetales bacterium]